ncbi:MAG: hypothetical protein V3T88_06700, partial [Nitrosomonadaceae bacterium]
NQKEKCVTARQVMVANKDMSYTEYRGNLALIFGGRGKKETQRSTATVVEVESQTSSTMEDASVSKNQQKKTNQELIRSNSAALNQLRSKLDQSIAMNQQYQEMLDPQTLKRVISNAVSSFQPKNQAANAAPSGNRYLGPERPSQLTKGTDGTINAELQCRYCRDTGHEHSNCNKLNFKKKKQAEGTWNPGRPRTAKDPSN